MWKSLTFPKSSYIMAYSHAGLVHQREQKFISGVGTGIDERVYLFLSQGFGFVPFSFDRDDPRGPRFRFSNTMQKGFVSSPRRLGVLVQRQCRNRPQACVIHIEAMDGPNGLVDGGIGSPGLTLLNGNDRGVGSA